MNTALVREKPLAFLVALIAAGIAFEPRIRAGGFNADDWPLYAAVKFPQIDEAHSVLASLQNAAGSRIGHMFYWLVSFSLFGSHTRLYSVTAALLAVVLAFSIYLLLRELKFSVTQSLAMMVLTLVAPSVEAVRFWFTPAGVQISLSLFFFGLVLALRAFAAPETKRKRLHLASWGLYVASAVYTETALPLIAVCILVYLSRATIAASLRRWAFDMIIVVAGYVAALRFVGSVSGFEKLPSSMWGEHARLIGKQALTIFTRMLGPLSASERTLALTGLAILASASFVLWRRGSISLASRKRLQRWGYTLVVCLAAIIVSYAVYVPAMVYYEPLGPGLATHINSVIAAPLAIGIFAVLMLTGAVVIELLGGPTPRVVYPVTALLLAWYATIVVASFINIRNDAHIWGLAAERDFHVLHVLTADLPHPRSNSTVYTFGEAGTVAPGMPIFFTSWEQTSAVKIAYDRFDVSSYPMVAFGLQPNCTSQGVTAYVQTVTVNSPSPYGHSYFLDIPSGTYRRIDSAAACRAALSQFHPGPYVGASLQWSQRE